MAEEILGCRIGPLVRMIAAAGALWVHVFEHRLRIGREGSPVIYLERLGLSFSEPLAEETMKIICRDMELCGRADEADYEVQQVSFGGRGITWGLSHIKNPNGDWKRYYCVLTRFDCDLCLDVHDPEMKEHSYLFRYRPDHFYMHGLSKKQRARILESNRKLKRRQGHQGDDHRGTAPR